MSNVQPVRIQRSRQYKQVSPNGLPIVYVGRPTVWGNPFQVGCAASDFFKLRQVNKYKNLIEGIVTPDMQPEGKKWMKKFMENVGQHPTEYAIGELRGKNLSCWCRIGEPCHADILLKIANK